MNDIWNTFNHKLLSFIRSKVNNREDAEDLLQEVFIKIYSRLQDLKNEDKLESWIYQITRNAVIDYYRKKKLVYTTMPEFIDICEKKEDPPRDFAKCLKAFISQLKKEEQDIINATAINGEKQKEYALRNGEAYSTIKSRLQRARKKLKDLFISCCQLQLDRSGNIIDASNCNC